MTTKIADFFSNNSVKCKTQLLESLISLILAVEKDIKPYVPHIMQPLITSMES